MWKFTDPENTVAITTNKIIKGESDILFVSHDAEDGAWQFLDGEADPDVKDALVVCLKDIVSKDKSIEDLADLPLGYTAYRESTRHPWSRSDTGDARN